MPLTDADFSEIDRISRKRSVRKISHVLLSNLDNKALSSLIATYLVLKAHGHPDSDLVTFFATKRTGKTLKLGLKAGGAMLSSVLTDSELLSLMMHTRSQLSRREQERSRKGEQTPRKRQRIVFQPTPP